MQDKINQILRGAETIKKNSMNPETTNCPNCGAKPMIHSYVCGTTFPNIAGNSSISEICKLTNEVAMLREENAALKQGKVFVDPKWIYNLETQLAKAHEELCQAGLREYGN